MVFLYILVTPAEYRASDPQMLNNNYPM